MIIYVLSNNLIVINRINVIVNLRLIAHFNLF